MCVIAVMLEGDGGLVSVDDAGPVSHNPRARVVVVGVLFECLVALLT